MIVARESYSMRGCEIRVMTAGPPNRIKTNVPQVERRFVSHLSCSTTRLFIVYCWMLVLVLSQSDCVAFTATSRIPFRFVRSVTFLHEGIGVGIDLGTTNSVIAFLEDDSPVVIEIPNNGRTMPSVVAVDRDSSNPIVGRQAIEWEKIHKTSAYRNIKRVIGTGSNHITLDTAKFVPHLIPYKSPSPKTAGKSKYDKFKKKKQVTLLKELQDAQENPTTLYPLHNSANDDQKQNSETKETVSPTTISSWILQKLLDAARLSLNKEITRAVIGVPAYFNDAQRDATIQAAKLAGIDKVKLLREPEAAALAYGLEQDSQGEELVLVFDLGGGTYDVSMLLVEDGLTEIVCTAGDSQLGGSNFDVRIAQRFATLTKDGKSTENMDAMVRVAEKVRIYLSNNRYANLALPVTSQGWRGLGEDMSGIILSNDDESFQHNTKNATHLLYQMTRKEVEGLCTEELQALLRPIREVAIMAGALLPGDARPSVVETALAMEEFYTQATRSEDDKSSVDEATLMALQAEMDMKEAKKAQQQGRKKARQTAKDERKYREESRKVIAEPDVKVRSNGISGRPISRVVLVGGVTRMPAIQRLIAAVTGVTPQKTVDPDEAVALGCAVHVGVLDGRKGAGTVLNPMQAAILRAVVEQQQRQVKFDKDEKDDDDDDEFMDAEYF
jgi:molecular chaperone DnaK (HSP70)